MIKNNRGFGPVDYPYQEEPDIVIYNRMKMTYEEYLEAHGHHFQVKLREPSPWESRGKLIPASPLGVAPTPSACETSRFPERGMVPEAIGRLVEKEARPLVGFYVAVFNRWLGVSLGIALCLEAFIFFLLLVVSLADEVVVLAPYGEAPFEACAVGAVICLTVYGLLKQTAQSNADGWIIEA